MSNHICRHGTQQPAGGHTTPTPGCQRQRQGPCQGGFSLTTSLTLTPRANAGVLCVRCAYASASGDQAQRESFGWISERVAAASPSSRMMASAMEWLHFAAPGAEPGSPRAWPFAPSATCRAPALPCGPRGLGHAHTAESEVVGRAALEKAAESTMGKTTMPGLALARTAGTAHWTMQQAP